MPRLSRLLGVSVAVAALSGCRASTQLVQEPRVDMEVDQSGNNRGYLVGTPPPARERETTRQVVQTEFEVPSSKRAGMSPPADGLKHVAPPEVDFAEPGTAAAPEPSQRFDTYTVKKGDTLWSIAADPKVYGDATKWRKLFSANQGTLKTPDGIRSGMTLRIPRGGLPSKAEPSADSGSRVYTK